MTAQVPRAIKTATAFALLLFPVASPADDRVGEIVRPATGTGRAVYETLDLPVILPHFLGTWAVKPGRCIGQKSRDRMELQQGLGIIMGHALSVETVLVDAGGQDEGESGQRPRASDFADARDLLVGFNNDGAEELRYIHFRFASGNTRLIVEEVGKPRRAYVRCSL